MKQYLLIAFFALIAIGSFKLNSNPMNLFQSHENSIAIQTNPPQVSGIKHIIFDLDGVIFTTSKKIYIKIAPYLPLYLIRKIYELQWTGISQEFLNTLAELKAEATEQSFNNGGQKIPQIMVDWLIGKNVFPTIKQQLQESKTLPYAYRKLILAIASNIFNPQSFIDSRTTIPEGIELLRSFKKNGYKVYALSNWDAQSFPLLKEKYPEIMNLFDGILISGEAKTLKPQKKMFMQFLQKFNLNAQDCIFIDDEERNVTAAQEQTGIASVLFNRKNINTAIKRLQKLNILKKTPSQVPKI